MALRISSIKRDLAVENEGEWHDIPEWFGVRIKARSIYSKDYQTAREMLVQSLTRKLGRMPTSPEMEPQLGKLVAIHLLRGWEGIVDGPEIPEVPNDGPKEVIEAAQRAVVAAQAAQVAIVWSPSVGLDYLSNPEYRELEHQVIWAANRTGDKEAKFTADASKNSAAPSVTI